jgi:hypothetical protein
MAEEQLVFAYCHGSVYSFERAHGHSASVFGGPMDYELSGVVHGPKPLHTIVRLSSMHLNALGPRLFDIPLIYGMCYDGCDIEYHVDNADHIEIRRMSPTESSDHWPYPQFPPLLPYVPLQIGETRSASYAEFAEPFPNMPEPQPTELVVVVPTLATLGVSLWGRGDGDDVIILFECDLADRMVYASNRCS